MSESSMRSTIVRALRPLDAQAIEVKGRAGVPDVNFIGGWMECKFRPKWARDCDVRPVTLPHPVTVEQKVWARRRVRRSGLVILAVKIDRDWLFYDCRTFEIGMMGRIVRPEMIRLANRAYSGGLNKKDFLDWIRSL